MNFISQKIIRALHHSRMRIPVVSSYASSKFISYRYASELALMRGKVSRVSQKNSIAFFTIHKAASGGELSRLSLAIRVASISKANVPCMIFDEVDVGIGGSVAEIVGKLLKELGSHDQRQVLVITHLPQVASLAVHHYKVSKTQENNQTLSHIHLMDEKMRVDEIARMLGGISITDTTREHAKEMLQA